MAPRGKRPTANNSLKGCCIVFATARVPVSAFNGQSTADLKQSIVNKGGDVVTNAKPGSDCTHLVAMPTQYSKRVGNVKDAIDNDDVKIVSFDWLEASLASKVPVDETQYLLHARNSNGTGNGSTNGAATKISTPTKKRSRTTTDTDDDTPRPGKKSKSEPTDSEKPESSPQKAKSKSLVVPADGNAGPGYKVYIDEAGIIYDATLNQTNSGQNNNKFYITQVLKHNDGRYWCWTRWGRVGDYGTDKMLGDGTFETALFEFNRKFKDKSGNTWENRENEARSKKYTFIEKSYEKSDDEGNASPAKHNGSKSEASAEDSLVASKLPVPVQRLMDLIFNKAIFASTLADLNYDASKMPLGDLSKRALLRGYEVLKQLSALAGQSGAQIEDLSNRYFTLIPHAFGRTRPPILNDLPSIKREIEILENLTDMQLADDIMKAAKNGKDAKTQQIHMYDRQYSGLGMREMTPLDTASSEFDEISAYLHNSTGATHRIKYTIQDIFRIEREGEFDRFQSSKFANISNSERCLLWHGSRSTNFGGILSQGLRIAPPEAPVSGYMFGKGVYLADMSSKSANYCFSQGSGGTGLLLLCEAELGQPPLRLVHADYNAGAVADQLGSISTLGVGRTQPPAWKDASCIHKSLKGVRMPDVKSKPPVSNNDVNVYLQYNEYIAYDIAQIKLRYLLRVQIA